MPLTIKCFIVEDEPLAQELLTDCIEMTPYLELHGLSANANTLCREITASKPDLIFLDIHLPRITGFELLSQLASENSVLPHVVITSAFANYALTGYDYAAIDFLQKPFDYERFLKAIDKVKRIMEPIYFLQQERLSTPPIPPSMLSVRVERGIETIPFQAIAYIEAMDNYVKIHHDQLPNTRPKIILSKVPLATLEKTLPFNKFIRISRSILVHIEKIKQIKENFIHLYDGSKLTIGGTYKESVRHYFT